MEIQENEIAEIIKKLKRFVLFIINDEDTAKDIVQKTVFKALEKGKLLKQHLGWLCTVAKHEVFKIQKNMHLPP